MRSVAALVCGLVFGMGLILSGMTDPRRVLAFLDIAGRWDPSLGVVLAAALAVAAPALALARRRSHALLGGPVVLSSSTLIDRRLVIGACLFGVGWGLAGLCPGPAIAMLLTLRKGIWLFVVAMLAGMAAFEAWQRLSRTAWGRKPATRQERTARTTPVRAAIRPMRRRNRRAGGRCARAAGPRACSWPP